MLLKPFFETIMSFSTSRNAEKYVNSSTFWIFADSGLLLFTNLGDQSATGTPRLPAEWRKSCHATLRLRVKNPKFGPRGRLIGGMLVWTSPLDLGWFDYRRIQRFRSGFGGDRPCVKFETLCLPFCKASAVDFGIKHFRGCFSLEDELITVGLFVRTSAGYSWTF